jgi:hypothetical protein
MSDTPWTPGPWRYEPGGGHASNRIVGSEAIQIHGWPERRNGIGNASYSDRICENLGDVALPGPAANARLIASAPDLYIALKASTHLINEAMDLLLHEGYVGEDMMNRLHDVLSKALGKEPDDLP